MAKFVIICDTAVEFYDEYKTDEVVFVPTEIDVDGKRYLKDIDDKEISLNTFYKYLNNERETKTNFIYPKLFIETATKYLKNDYDVLFLTCSNKLSGNYYSTLVAKDYLHKVFSKKKICCINSFGFSSKEYLVLKTIMKLQSENKEVDEVEKLISDEINENLYQQITLCNSIDRLANSNRIPKSCTDFSTFLNNKPIYQTTQNGSISLLRKVRGWNRLVNSAFLILEKENEENKIEEIAISYTFNKMDAVNLANKIISKFKLTNTSINPMSILVSSYTDLNSISIAWKRTKK